MIIPIQSNIKKLKIATVVSENFKFYKNFHKLLTYQRPTYFLNEKANDRIVNCVHRVKNLDENLFKRLMIWLKIMFKIGYSKVYLYDNYIDGTYKEKILQSFANFAHFIDYNTKLEDCCYVSRKKLELYPNNKFFHEEIIKCVNNYHMFLKGYNKSTGLIDQAVNRLGSNDCLMHSKFQYKYLTNLDFDEFILPRNFKTHLYRDIELNNNLSLCNNFKILKQQEKFNYNMIDYILLLTSKYKSNVAYFQFENFQLLADYKSIKSQLNRKQNKTIIFYQSDKANLEFTFKISSNLNKMKKLVNLTDCFNDTLVKLEPIYRNFIGSIINNRLGKSIFITENTVAIHPHAALLIKPKTEKITIPIAFGNVLHIRNRDTTIKAKFSDNELNIDIEYLIFLRHIFN